MKKIFLKVTLALNICLLLLSCNNNTSNNGNSTDSLTRTADSKMQTDSNINKMSAVMNEFVSKAMAGGMMEVALGRLAQTNSNRQDIKDYGKMLETDHANANTTLQGIASAENISIPVTMTDEQATHIKDMDAKKGADFDKDFISMMVDDHTKNIVEFKEAAAGNANEKVKEFAAKALPVLQKHLDKAKAIKAKMK